MLIRLFQHDRRTFEEKRQHYEIEKELADRLRKASKEERRYLYSVLYDELFHRVPHHPQLTQKRDPLAQSKLVTEQIKLLKGFLRSNTRFLEVGPGDCSLAFEVAKFVKEVIAVDVSEKITQSAFTPPNFKLFISDGSSIPGAENQIDVVYSRALMEHLHPDDAEEQIMNIYKVLKPGGVYICCTPNRLYGPHDISRYFDDVAKGFHLKEYTNTELINLFKIAGFKKFHFYIGLKGYYLKVPVGPVLWFERLVSRLPRSLIKSVSNTVIGRVLLRAGLGCRIAATK